MGEAINTPRPWKHVGARVQTPGGRTICQLPGSGFSVPLSERAGNGRLIAAAPDGHKILAAVHEFFRHHNPVEPSALMPDDDRTLRQAVADYMAKVAGGNVTS
jgi:hypothetical protein